MKKAGCFLLLSFLAGMSWGQPGDFLQLKKGSRTIKTWFKGSSIDFITYNNQLVSGRINVIKDDTLYLQTYDVRMRVTPWSTRVPDTITSYLLPYYYKDILYLPKKSKGFEFIKNGTLLILAGAGYAVLHLVNSAYLKEDVEWDKLAIAASIAGAGVLMHTLRKNTCKIGKKYQLSYVPMQ